MPSYLNIEKIFKYHPPTENQVERYEVIRAAAKNFAELITDNSPQSPEQTLAIRALQECVMWVNAGIAINEST